MTIQNARQITFYACLCLSVVIFFPPFPAFAADQLEMDVITVYGKESYRLRKEVFELLTPLRKEELSKLQLKKRMVEEVEPPARRAVVDYDTAFTIRPAGDVPSVSVVRTGVLLYFLSRRPEISNLHLEFTPRAGEPQDFYLKRVLKDQYIEAMLPEGVYRLVLKAEGVEPSAADSIVIRAGQISLAFITIAEPILPPPPPPVEKIPEVAVETAPPPPPPPPVEQPLNIRFVSLRKQVPLPEAQPTVVTRGRVKFHEKGLVGMEVRLYEHEVGFFDPYDPAVEDALLAVTVTDTYGNFEFPPIDNDDGFLEGTRDPVIVLSLENSLLSVLKPFAGTRSIPYRYVIYQRENINPEEGNFTVGEIAVTLSKEKPVQIFQNALSAVRKFSTPIQVIFPSGSAYKLSSRRLHIPAAADLTGIADQLQYLTP